MIPPPQLRDAFEIVSAYALILAVLWTPMPAQQILLWIAFAWVLLITFLRGERPSAMGLTFSGLLPSLWVLFAAATLCGIAVLIAMRVGTFHPLFGKKAPLAVRIGGYALWSLLQEFILQVYFLLRLLHLFRNRAIAIGVSSGLFAIAHLPNPVLTVLTLLWGLIACPLYLRYRNLYTLGMAHAVLGICVAVTVPDSLHHHMRVGTGYITYSREVQQVSRGPIGSSLK